MSPGAVTSHILFIGAPVMHLARIVFLCEIHVGIWIPVHGTKLSMVESPHDNLKPRTYRFATRNGHKDPHFLLEHKSVTH